MSEESMQQMRRMSFDRVAHRYDATRGGEARGRASAAAMRDWLKPEGPVLEVGVGTGLVAAAMRDSGVAVFGVDVSLEMLGLARPRVGPTVVVGDALRLPMRDGSVASAYAVHVLHLVGDLGRLFVETRRVVRPGGRVLVVCAAGDEGETEADQLVTRLYRRVRGERPDVPHLVVPAAERAGLRLVHEQVLTTPMDAAPTYYADLIEERVWSWTWDLDETTWAAEVAPIVAELRSMPDPDQPRPSRDRTALLVFEAPPPLP